VQWFKLKGSNLSLTITREEVGNEVRKIWIFGVVLSVVWVTEISEVQWFKKELS
jgi:hypothetical protein